MPRLSLWNPVKRNDWKFIDRIIGEHIYAGGTGVHVHKYLGIHETTDVGDASRPPSGASDAGEVFIQDLLFLEIFSHDINMPMQLPVHLQRLQKRAESICLQKFDSLKFYH